MRLLKKPSFTPPLPENISRRVLWRAQVLELSRPDFECQLCNLEENTFFIELLVFTEVMWLELSRGAPGSIVTHTCVCVYESAHLFILAAFFSSTLFEHSLWHPERLGTGSKLNFFLHLVPESPCRPFAFLLINTWEFRFSVCLVAASPEMNTLNFHREIAWG